MKNSKTILHSERRNFKNLPLQIVLKELMTNQSELHKVAKKEFYIQKRKINATRKSWERTLTNED
jgi:ATP-dependent helicase/DNAse subunit B